MSSEQTSRTVAVFGAGIAGLTAAHELSRLGHRVRVYEAASDPGGFFRSARMRNGRKIPTEYSWHGLGPWYHNAFDLLKQIPYDATDSLYNKGLSRPIDFGIFPDEGSPQFYDRGFRSIPRMFRFARWEFVRWAWLMLKTWTANHRTEQRYSRQNAAEAWKPLLGETGYRTWRACFGPWIGSDWTKASLHTAGQFFRKQLTTRPAHYHPADADGPAWTQGAGDGWLLFRGPSSDYWFDRWVPHLVRQGVAFAWDEALCELDFDGSAVTGARLSSGAHVTADAYILATNPFAAAKILSRTPSLETLPELRRFKPLIQDGPHVQVSFRLAFAEPIQFPRERTAVVVADSEFNLTLFAEEQVWRSNVELGTGVRSLWTGTSCVGTVPGRVHGLPVIHCTKEEFIDEVKAQIFGCEALNRAVAEANDGRRLVDFKLLKIEVWHEWIFSPDGIHGPQPKWVTTTNTHPHLPRQATSIPNLFLAGAHTRTEADVWSVEGAVESGRRAAQAFDPRVPVIPQYKPRLLCWFGAIDDLFFKLRAPHVLDLGLLALIATLIAMLTIPFVT